MSLGLLAAVALVWINAYICRDLWSHPTAYMNSMHGFWIALASRAGDSWFHPVWWPYWDMGIPFEFTYAPLVPALTAAWASLGRVSDSLAFQSVTGVVYCLGPLSLFAMAWVLTRAPGASFLAALFYSLTAITNLIVPDDRFSLAHFWDARRFYLLTVWDDTPHAAALALLPFAILFLVLSLRERRFRYYIPATLAIALMAAASQFGIIDIMLAALCLLFVFRRHDYGRNIAVTLGLGAFAYALVAPFLPPSLWSAIAQASGTQPGGGFSLGSITGIAVVALGWALVWRYLPRWTTDWTLQFFALFAYLTASIPILFAWMNRQFLPQPGRYKFEMELALSLLVVFGLRSWFLRAPRSLQVTSIALVVAFAGEQIVSHRKFAKIVLQPRDETETIEARTTRWIAQNLPGARVMLPGSIAQWADDFAPIPQFSGSSWSQAASQVQQRGLAAILNSGPRQALAWLQAYGVSAVATSGPKSQEAWKPFSQPAKFEGLLPVLWRADDVTIYQVPRRSNSLAHVVPAGSIVKSAPRSTDDVSAIEAYVKALDDPSAPAAEFQWQGRNRILIRTSAAAGQAISVQVSYHPGWHAHSGKRPLSVKADGLGLLWLEPDCNGSCDVQLDYDGGWELRLCRYLSYAALLLLAGVVVLRAMPRR
ncbi:MAG: hypothetical protein C5B51_27780 [Terriglobia bacterium]|nr:MAG: hypothetical protein C5B51_27780 [Terriglobia bacterium]